MSRQKLLKIVNILLIIDFILIAVTAFLHDYIPYETYRKIHVIPGFILVFLVTTHLILNWPWIKRSYLSDRR